MAERGRPAPEERTVVEDFVRDFAAGWRAEKPDGFLAHFLPRIHPEARFVQPMIPTAHGPEGFESSFRELFSMLPDYAVTVEDWAARGSVVCILLTHAATFGGRRRSWSGVDWITLTDDGRIRERVAHFDPIPLLPATLRTPRTWPRMLRWTLAGGGSRA